ncbi:MAG: YabP/YqfC family sporulation protein [Clostridia bacterium]
MSSKKKDKKKWYKQISKSINIRNNISLAKEKFSEFLELPPEVVSSSTKITAIENTDILIEGYKKIIDYYDNYIKIRAHNMNIVIDGKDLDIKEITDFELVIQGKIYSLNYQK